MIKILKLRRLWLLLAYPAAFAATLYASSHEAAAERYARGPYAALARAGNFLTGLAPFSIGEILVYLLAACLMALLVRTIAGAVRGKGRRAETVLKFFVNLLCFGGVVYLVFTVNCGINYYRSTFAQTCGLPVKPSSAAELTRLCGNLADDADAQRARVATDGEGVMKLSTRDFARTAQQARQSFDLLSADYPLLPSGYSAPKPVLGSRLMSRCNLTGMFFPFTFEANVNTDAPEYTIPVTMCHELSHLRGFMREDEANFIGYLACEKSESADFKYSGTMLAFTYASNALLAADEKADARVWSCLSEGVKKDLAYNSAYWKQFEGPVAKISDSVNNSYLKANRQSDGVQSYGRMVDLLLALQRKEEASAKK